LSDEQVEFQINDRMSFMRFLDLSIADDIPDSRTVWNFREQLTKSGLVVSLFSLFIQELERLNLIINKGKIIDASFVEVPRQRNSREENAQIKSGQTPASFTENPHKQSQKDVDARWMVGEPVEPQRKIVSVILVTKIMLSRMPEVSLLSSI
jgi:IS5 family transposase